ncbi:Adiponectin receptor protein 2, partial [Gonapodya sp. JEL0774]
GSFAPTLHYAFYCNPQTAHIYMAVQVVLGTVAVGTDVGGKKGDEFIPHRMLTAPSPLQLFVTLSPRFGTPNYRVFRASLFVVLGLAGVVPSLHVVVGYG